MKSGELASTLRLATSKLVKRLRKHMHAVNGLSMTEVDTLSYLYHAESLSPTQLAELLNIKGQSMSEVLSHLCSLNIIDKKASLSDKRKFDVSLTQHGREMVEQTRYERDEWLINAIDKNLSSKEKEILAQAIALIKKLGEHEA